MFQIITALRSTRHLRWVPFRCRGISRCRTATDEVPVVEREFHELQIPIPYGHLAAKQWLPMCVEDPHQRVLLLHGFQDNAGSFDPLVPRLDPRWHAVALDFTGHGLSSHLPKGAPYLSMQFLLDISRAVNHLGWSQFSMIGHSMGGGAALNYACIFPERVQNLVLIDVFAPWYEQPSKVSQTIRAVLEGNMQLEQKDLSRPPVYTEEEVIKLYRHSIVPGYLPDNIRTLMKRGCKPVGDGRYILTKDIRLKYIHWIRADRAALKEYYRGYTNNLLVVMAVPGLGGLPANHKIVSDICAQNCRTFQIVEVEGNHHVHMTHPDEVASHIRRFCKSTLM
ncbi:serine hydrolase-like protein [Dermacentor andersoni]|uniref:serine hydrolase-like protein n=1 Tax=Dermacentor andersoni TaxID=34620 RepID=UPI002155CE60|nr:serine hydrolase-like protein [Dermacentor andersoni]XP_054933127.1 serine hydrolase-like protein [Dermacentor andersoni]XP_054933128.1 serine hydrolase-like protein [Dermacentor andersoni]XP_054933129.1 serine hydrolase-like protein [Dermacentor andersoni]